jgi:transketolase
LTRQNTQPQTRDEATLALVNKGGYVLKECDGIPDLILIASGSEVELATAAYEKLTSQGHAVRVVSMPCFEIFKHQSPAYQASVLSNDISKRVAIEAGSSAAWFGFVQSAEQVVGIDRFGLSAPGPQVFTALGVTLERVLEVSEKLLK